jgi:hypothetical protein
MGEAIEQCSGHFGIATEDNHGSDEGSASMILPL